MIILIFLMVSITPILLAMETAEKLIPQLPLVEKAIGYSFAKQKRLIKALTMPQADPKKNYEKYELYGDSILRYGLTELLRQLKLKDDTPDGITQARMSLEQNGVLALLGEKLQLTKWIVVGRGYTSDAIVADVTEAVLGAICKDGGPTAAQKFINRFWLPMLLGKETYPLMPDKIISNWTEQTGAAPQIFKVGKTKQKKISSFKEKVKYIREHIPAPFQERLPILPTEVAYAILAELKDTASPQWGEKLLQINARMHLHTIAQLLAAVIKLQCKDVPISFLASVEIPGLGKIQSSGPNKKEAGENLAAEVLHQLKASAVADKLTAFLAGQPGNKNSRQLLHEWYQQLDQAVPQINIEEDQTAPFIIQASFDKQPLLSDLVSDWHSAATKKEAKEAACQELAHRWGVWLRENHSTLPNPKLFMAACLKFQGLKKVQFEDWAAERKLTEPEQYYSRILRHDGTLLIKGPEAFTVLEAQDLAAKEALLILSE